MRAAYSMMRGGGAEAGSGEGKEEGTHENAGDRKRKSDDHVVGGVPPVELGKRGKDGSLEDEKRVGGDGGGEGRGGDGGGRTGKRRIREATPDKVGLRYVLTGELV